MENVFPIVDESDDVFDSPGDDTIDFDDAVFQTNDVPLIDTSTIDVGSSDIDFYISNVSDESNPSEEPTYNIEGYGDIASLSDYLNNSSGVIELLDGRLLMYMRTDQGVQYFSYSQNGGITWSKIEKGTLKSPLSPATLERNPYTQEIVAVWNNSKTERMPLCLAISQDEALNWIDKCYLENLPEYSACYSAIEFLSEDLALILYSIAPKEQFGLGNLKLVLVRLN